VLRRPFAAHLGDDVGLTVSGVHADAETAPGEHVVPAGVEPATRWHPLEAARTVVPGVHLDRRWAPPVPHVAGVCPSVMGLLGADPTCRSFRVHEVGIRCGACTLGRVVRGVSVPEPGE
jgi:hypothetical protein